MARTKNPNPVEKKRKTFRFDSDLQAVFDEISLAVAKKVPTKYFFREPSEQEVLEYVLKDYKAMCQRVLNVLGGEDEG